MVLLDLSFSQCRDGGWWLGTAYRSWSPMRLAFASHKTIQFRFSFSRARLPTPAAPTISIRVPIRFVWFLAKALFGLAPSSLSLSPPLITHLSRTQCLWMCVCLSVKWVYFSAKLLKMAFLVEIFIALFLCFNSSLREEKFCQLQINGNRFRSA